MLFTLIRQNVLQSVDCMIKIHSSSSSPSRLEELNVRLIRVRLLYNTAKQQQESHTD